MLTAQHWRDRAKEMRELAAQTSDMAVKRAMLDIAKRYERLAERADDRADGKKSS